VSIDLIHLHSARTYTCEAVNISQIGVTRATWVGELFAFRMNACADHLHSQYASDARALVHITRGHSVCRCIRAANVYVTKIHPPKPSAGKVGR
jgi:hypothetical protein